MDSEKLSSSGEWTAWYALQVKSRHEKAVARNFHTQGLEEFLPLYRVRRAWCDRIKVVELPLLPKYIFCRFDPRNRAQILRMPSVTSIVSFNNTLAPIEDAVIAFIRTIIQSGVDPKCLLICKPGKPSRSNLAP